MWAHFMQLGPCCAAAFGGCCGWGEVKLNPIFPIVWFDPRKEPNILQYSGKTFDKPSQAIRQSGTPYSVVNHSRAASIPRPHPLSLPVLISETHDAVNSKDPRKVDEL